MTTNSTARADDHRGIRTLAQGGADAAPRGARDAVLARHTHDIVMFDVPPPEDGARGIEAYTATWPPFLEFQAAGGTFDILELDVTPGDDVAYAWALLRCGQPAENAERPDRRLRLTLGLRR